MKGETVLFSSGSPVAAFAKQRHAPTQRKMMMRQKKGKQNKRRDVEMLELREARE